MQENGRRVDNSTILMMTLDVIELSNIYRINWYKKEIYMSQTNDLGKMLNEATVFVLEGQKLPYYLEKRESHQ